MSDAPDALDDDLAPEPAPPDPQARRSRSRLVAVALSLALAVVVVVGVVVAVGRAGSDDEPLSGAEAADAFVDAYTRHLDATFRVEGELTRTLADGRSLSSAYLVVQRPPDRIQRSLGSTSGELGGRSVNCSTPLGDEYTCATGAEMASSEERRASTIAAVESYVRGDDPVYVVTVDDQGCFDLVSIRPEVEASFGSGASLCFDERYWALRRLEVQREGGATDVMLATLITDQVTGADFDVQGDATYDPDVPDDAGTSPAPTSTSSPAPTSQEPPP